MKRSEFSEERVLADAEVDRQLQRRRSFVVETVPSTDKYIRRAQTALEAGGHVQHLLDVLGPGAKAVRLGPRIEDYVEHRRQEGASEATIRIELALLDRGLRLAVKKKLISTRSKPEIEKPTEDTTRVRRGFF